MIASCGGRGHWQQRADVVVIGTGVAGLVAALAAHRSGRKVVVLSKAGDTATFYAQGGIAVVLPDTEDSIDQHVADTLAAGAGLAIRMRCAPSWPTGTARSPLWSTTERGSTSRRRDSADRDGTFAGFPVKVKPGGASCRCRPCGSLRGPLKAMR